MQALDDQLEHASLNVYVILLVRAELLPPDLLHGPNSSPDALLGDSLLGDPLQHAPIHRGTDPSAASLSAGADQ